MNGNGAQPPSGNAQARNTGGMNAAAAIAMPSRRFVRSPPCGERVRHAGHREEEPGHGAAERAQDGEHDRERVAAALEREQRGEPERHADRERAAGS